jgi:hypothetical protein
MALSSLCGVLISNCKWRAAVRIQYTVNVWFRFMYEAVLPCYFQNRIIMFCLPISTFMYLRATICVFPGLVCLFCCSQIGQLILGIYKSLTDTNCKCRNWEQGCAVSFLGIHTNRIFGTVHNHISGNWQIPRFYLSLTVHWISLYIECVRNWSPLTSFPSPTPHSTHPI